MKADSEYWADYYAVTVDRPPWQTVRLAITRFREEDEAGVAERNDAAGSLPRLAVDLGCGAGRDTRELLRAGWRVLAVDREAGARSALGVAVEPEFRERLEVHVEDLATVRIPACNLVNASLCLPFLPPPAFRATWDRIVAALQPGGRFAAMLFGERDDSASDPEMTCPSAEAVRSSLGDLSVEYWLDREEDSQTALGEPHHFHLIEFVARKAG